MQGDEAKEKSVKDLQCLAQVLNSKGRARLSEEGGEFCLL